MKAMNYELEISQSLPVSFNSMNGNRPPLVAGSGGAMLLADTSTQSFQPWTSGLEHEPFSIEIWFLPVKVTAEMLIVGHNIAGVFWDGSDYILRFEYENGVIEGRWSPLEIQTSHIVVTYDTARADLWVNGELIVSLDVAKGDSFVRVQKMLNLHRAAPGDEAVYDSLALYHRTLSEREIKTHYVWGRSVTESWDIASSRGATTWRLAYQDVDVATSFVFDESNWGSYFADGLSIVDGYLTPDTSGGGVWMGSIPLGPVVGDTSAGVHLTYAGQGVTLSYSTDGSNWTVVSNKTTVLEDSDATDLQLFLKIEMSSEVDWVSSLRLDVIGTRTIQPFSGSRLLYFRSAAMDQTPGKQLDFHVDAGAQIGNGGNIAIAPDRGEVPIPVRSVEMWVKLDSNSDGYLLYSADANIMLAGGVMAAWQSNIYVNGVPYDGEALKPSYWYHIVLVFDLDSNDLITFGSAEDGSAATDMAVGHLAVYPEAFLDPDVLKIYRMNVGDSALRVDDAGGIDVTEDASPARVFAYSWSYVAGGS